MLLSWCFAVVLINIYSSLAAPYAEKKYIFVSKHSEYGITWHSYYSTQTAPDGYQPITSRNKLPGEVSYFRGYSRNYTPFRGCKFDVPLHIMEALTPMPDNKYRRERFRILKEGQPYIAFRIVDTVYVAGSSCSGQSQGLTELYQAACAKIFKSTIHETMYSRISTRANICEKSHYHHHEGKFYAYVDRPCPNLSGPSNGRLQGKWDLWERLREYTYSCNTGYELQGDGRRHCRDNGQWSGPAPSCTRVRCPELSNPQHGRLSSQDNRYGSVVTYICDHGYPLDPPRASTTCQANRQWSSHNGMSCKLMNCDKPAAPENGAVTGSQYSYGSTIRYSCNAGYRLQGADQSTCRLKGWEGKVPTCVGVRCPGLSQLDHGQACGYSYAVGAQWSFHCEMGYNLIGPKTITCMQNGDDAQWSQDSPSCKVMICAKPAAPENGIVTGNQYSYGSTIRYSCNAGYRLQGADQSICRMEGWEGKVPTCVAITCPRIRTPYYSSREGDAMTVGATMHFYCDPGYEMQGDPKITCQANGTWSKPAPVCSACPLGFYKEKIEDRKCSRCPQRSTTLTTASSSKQYCTCVEGTTGPPGGPCTSLRRLTSNKSS